MMKKIIYETNPLQLLLNGLNKLFKNNQSLTIFILVISLVELGFSFSQKPIENFVQTFTNKSSGLFNINLATFIIVILFILISIIFNTLISGMSAYLATSNANNKRSTIKQAYQASLSKFWTVFGVNFMVALKTILGFILFIIPGIRAMIRYNFSLIYVFDENTNVKQSMKKSRQLSEGHLIEIMGLMIWSGIVPLINSITVIGSKSELYHQLKALKSSPHKLPPVHLLNYLIIILLTLILVIFLLFLASAFIYMKLVLN